MKQLWDMNKNTLPPSFASVLVVLLPSEDWGSVGLEKEFSKHIIVRLFWQCIADLVHFPHQQA